MQHLTLGKSVSYSEYYDASLLQAVPRSLGRDNIGLKSPLPFSGADIWNGYELSWLNTKNKPQVAILQCSVPITSKNLIESKSFKLYLNSLNQTQFGTINNLNKTIQQDLSQCAEEPVDVTIIPVHQFNRLTLNILDGRSIDDIDIEITSFDIRPDILHTENVDINETLVSHLLKSNCLITNQPDWGSLLIKYEGKKINEENLLKYIVSFRQHNEFHEQCVERIFNDIQTFCKPDKLTVYARYTRRGGLDINPFRSNFEKPYSNQRLARQ